MIELPARIHAFAELGRKINDLNEAEKAIMAQQARAKNQWFTEENVNMSLTGIVNLLSADKLKDWTTRYKFSQYTYRVGIVMAGNIPLVGFHDFLSVLISGHKAVIKLSTQDDVLLKIIAAWLIEIEPKFEKFIDFAEKLTEIDAVIATGSDNSSRYFNQYFGHMPNIIRKNRTSCAIIRGDESAEDIFRLGKDIFSYFGLGCRNIAKILIPKDYDLTQFLDHLKPYHEILHHHKYNNNYDYNKSIYLVNREEHLDNGFLLLKPSSELVSPLAVLYYEEYNDRVTLETYVSSISGKLQCLVSADGWFPGSFDFGLAQKPDVDDYADGVDTLEFLSELSQKEI